MLQSLQNALPPSRGGWLPYWMLFVSTLAVFNTIQNYVGVKLTSRIYSRSAVSPLTSRLFGMWTLVSAVARIQAAYNINNQGIYDMVIATYAIVVFHYLTEWFVYKTAIVSAPLLMPMFIGTGSLVWMISQRSFYLH